MSGRCLREQELPPVVLLEDRRNGLTFINHIILAMMPILFMRIGNAFR